MRCWFALLGLMTVAGARAQGTPPIIWSIDAHVWRVQDIDFSPDGSELVTAGEDKSIKFWDAETGALRRQLTGLGFPVGTARYSPDGRLIASAHFVHEGLEIQNDHAIRIWRAGDLSLVATLLGHTSDVQAVAFSPDGSMIAGAGRDGTLRTWRTGDWLPAGSVSVSQFQWPTMDVEYLPDGRILTLDFSGEFKLFTAHLEPLATIPTSLHSVFSSMVITPDGRCATAVAFGQAAFLNLETLQHVVKSTVISQCYSATASPKGEVIFGGLGGQQEIESWNHRTAVRNRMWDGVTGSSDFVFGSSFRPGTSDFAYGTFRGKLIMAKSSAGLFKKTPQP
ncbi:MAG: hypothetical protein HONBIEJF_01699 [Fimbriimonadaceae bacterium]|nr:hypothetical protein [Fimbriimonadaceae bacterium]